VIELRHLGNVVPEGYTYYEKVITPGDDAPITDAKREESRAFLELEVERLNINGELGFVILHRAGSMLLLMLITWRNTNELWESVYTKDLTSGGGYALTNFGGTHRGTYCVWELGAVWHERHAWVRFLSSPRDDAAKLAYINDRFSGRI
jgi:hypothetical protein